MKNHWGRIAAALGVGAGLVAFMVLAPATGRKNHRAPALAWAQPYEVTPERVIESWPPTGKTAAEAMLQKYGQPGHVENDSLTWYNNGAWKRTTVYREAYESQDPALPNSVIEQAITYRVPADRVDALVAFDDRIVSNRSRDELSFRADSEKKNFLAINLADEIVNREKTVEEARAFYHKQLALMEAGKSSRYMTGFLFTVDNENARP